MNFFKKEYEPKIGSYLATASGYSARFNDGKHEYEGRFENGIRGLGYLTTVDVKKIDGNISITATTLGKCVSLMIVCTSSE